MSYAEADIAACEVDGMEYADVLEIARKEGIPTESISPMVAKQAMLAAYHPLAGVVEETLVSKLRAALLGPD